MRAENTMIEKHVFIKNRNRQNLYADIFIPKEMRQQSGIVLCPPIAEERNITRRIMVNAGRLFAEKGYAALLFDYYGEGDSEGRFEEATVESRVSDILDAIMILRQETGLAKIGLLGMRFGATCAILAADSVKDVAFVITWQLVFNGEDFFQKWLRSNLASQMVLYKKIMFPREQLIEGLLRGEPLEIDGYIISRNFYLQLKNISLSIEHYHPYCNYLIIEMSDNPEKENKNTRNFVNQVIKRTEQCDFLQIKKIFDWSNMKVYDPKPEQLFQTTIDWLITK